MGRTWGVLALLLAVAAESSGMAIQFDYSFDSSGFFTANPTAKTTLNAVGQMFSARLQDTLSALIPQGSNKWDLAFTRPDTGNSGEWVHNASVAANTLVVYVGARDIGGTTLAQGGPGGWNASGSQSWLDLLGSRGESNTKGATATDFGPWGGTLSFDDDAASYGWHFDSTTPPPGGKADFYTTAMHELAHVLGFGTADSWDARVTGSGSYFFTGPTAVATNGGNVPLDAGQHHWQQGLTSPVSGHSQIAVMTPVMTLGTRQYFTDVDWAALDDVGWEVAAPGILRGDLNQDRLINALDIGPFVARLTSGTYQAQADLNADGAVNALDISPFITAMTGGGSAAAAVPEAGSGGLLALGVLAFRRARRA